MTLFKPKKADDNDFPTPDGIFFDILFILKPILNIDFSQMIDGCCTPENKKFTRGYTIQENALEQDWSKERNVKFVWLAVPYGGRIKSPFYKHKNRDLQPIQPMFVGKALEQAEKGIITIALVQSNVHEPWFKDLITKNENCHAINMVDKIKYDNLKGQFRGATLVIFGIKKGSIPKNIDEEISYLPSKYKMKPNGNWKISDFTYGIKKKKKKKSGSKVGRPSKLDKMIIPFLNEWKKHDYSHKYRAECYMKINPYCKSDKTASTGSYKILQRPKTIQELKKRGFIIEGGKIRKYKKRSIIDPKPNIPLSEKIKKLAIENQKKIEKLEEAIAI